MWNCLSLRYHINTRITVYRGGLITVYESIAVHGSLVISPYVYPQTVDIPCS